MALLRPGHALEALKQLVCPSEEHEPTDADMRPAKTERLVFLFCANTSGDPHSETITGAENQAHILPQRKQLS